MKPARLPVLGTLREIPGVYRRHWKLLIGLALLVTVPKALAETGFGEVELSHPTSGELALGLGEGAVAVAISLLGEAVYAGAVTVAVLDWRGGLGVPGPRDFIRALPLGKLVLVDLLIVFGTALGFALLVIPGIVFLTLAFTAPVLIEVEHLGVFASIRRTAGLVRGNFLRVLTLLALVGLGTSLIGYLLGELAHELFAHFAVELATEALLEPIQGLLTVLVALRLLEIHGSPALAAIGEGGRARQAPSSAN